MAHVILPKPLAERTGGILEIEVDARNVRGLIRELDSRFPGLGEVLSEQTTVAIDGEIVNDALLQPVEPDNEIHFLPRVSGG